MKFSGLLVTAALLAAPMCGSAAMTPSAAGSGALLSTNLSAAVLRVNNLMGVSSNGLYAAGTNTPVLANPNDTICIGGSDCTTNPITGPSNPCTPSPENGTALLAVLGLAGLLSGRFGYRHMQRSRTAAIAA